MSEYARKGTEGVGAYQPQREHRKRGRTAETVQGSSKTMLFAESVDENTEPTVGRRDPPIVVGERPGEPGYNKARKPATRKEFKLITPTIGHGPRVAPLQAQSYPYPEPVDLPVPAHPEVVYRPNMDQIYQSLLALDDITKRDAGLRAKVADMRRLFAVIQKKESDVQKKLNHVQRTRIAIQEAYVAKVKQTPSLIAHIHEEEVATETRNEPTGRKRRTESQGQPSRASKRLRRQVMED